MANQLQLVVYEGFLAADPELRFLPSGVPVTNFRMGSNRSHKNADGERVKETTWLKVTVWGKYGEDVIYPFCAKGSHVIVTGRLRGGPNGSPTPYKLSTGEWAASFEMVADNVNIIKGREGANPPTENTDEGDLPFQDKGISNKTISKLDWDK